MGSLEGLKTLTRDFMGRMKAENGKAFRIVHRYDLGTKVLMCVCVCMYACMYICIIIVHRCDLGTKVLMCVCMYVYMYVCMHVCIYA